MVNPRRSNENFEFLGFFSNIRECIQMAIKDEKNTYQNVVYTEGNKGTSSKEYFNSCYANYRGRKYNPVEQIGVITAFAPQNYSKKQSNSKT